MDFPKMKPVVTHDNKVFWDGCKEHKLLIQKCAECGTLQHPPRPLCAKCHSFDKEYVEASGKGTVHSFMIGERSLHPAYPPGFNIVLVDMAEGVRIVGTIVDAEADEVDFDMPVTLDFEEIDEECSIPVFRKA